MKKSFLFVWSFNLSNPIYLSSYILFASLNQPKRSTKEKFRFHPQNSSVKAYFFLAWHLIKWMNKRQKNVFFPQKFCFFCLFFLLWIHLKEFKICKNYVSEIHSMRERVWERVRERDHINFSFFCCYCSLSAFLEWWENYYANWNLHMIHFYSPCLIQKKIIIIYQRRTEIKYTRVELTYVHKFQ